MFYKPIPSRIKSSVLILNLLVIYLLVSLIGVSSLSAQLTNLQVTGGILARPYPALTPANTLIQGVEKDIQFTIRHTAGVTATKSVKLFIVNQGNGNAVPVYEAILSFSPYQTRSIAYNISDPATATLRSAVSSPLGTYTLVLMAKDGTDLTGVQLSNPVTSPMIPQNGGINPLRPISVIANSQPVSLTDIQMTTGINAVKRPCGIGALTLEPNALKDINFRIQNTTGSAVIKSLKLFIINLGNNSVDVVFERAVALNANEIKYLDFNYDANLGSIVVSSPGSYRLELRGLDGNNLPAVTISSPLVNPVNGAVNRVNISVVDPNNSLSDLRVTAGILAVKYPTSIGNNILEQNAEKNITFTLSNTCSTSVTRSFKLYSIDANNIVNVVAETTLTIGALLPVSLNRFNTPSLGTLVTSNPGQYRYELRGNNSSNYATVSLTSPLIPVTNAVNPVYPVTVNPAGPCMYTDLGGQDAEVQSAYTYLCNNGVLTPQPCGGNGRCGNPNDLIIREDVAKILFISLWGANTDPLTTVAGKFPNPFNDLQTVGNLGQYHAYARVLSYLEYGNGIAAFDRDKFNFKPGATIERRYFVKALLEAWNIAPNNALPNPFNDVPDNDPMYPYLRKAYDLGITTQGSFRPYANILRSETFLMLYRLMNNNGGLRPTLSTLNNLSSYFMPGNHTLKNLGLTPSTAHGNFSSYEKTSFSIPDTKFSLDFSHSYQSYLNELPEELTYLQPLGKGWNHNYNMFMVRTEDSRDVNNNVVVPAKLAIGWPDGSFHIYQNPDAPNPTPVTLGVYDKVTRISATQYELKTKSQVVYTFESLVMGPATLFVITRITDRNNNSLLYTYVTGRATVAGQGLNVPVLDKVTAPSGRFLKCTYDNSDPNRSLLSQIDAPDGRFIRFSYDPGKRLMTYLNPKSALTYYFYETLFPGAYLKTIRLPKGNTVTNEYDAQRKLKKTTAGINRYIQTARTNYAYPNNPEVGVTYSSTVTTENGLNVQTVNQNHDAFSRTTQSVFGGNTLGYQYTDGNHPMLPNRIDGVTQNTRVECSYDFFGNITEVRKYSTNNPVATERMSYNSFNDITRYTDAIGVVTDFTYHLSGNLKEVITPSGMTTIQYNPNGTVLKTINPSGIVTDYLYNSYGNLTRTDLPAISSWSITGYDAASRVSYTEDALGRRTSFQYDANDNLTQVTGPAPTNYVTAFAYDANDNQTSITNARGGVTSMTYDFNTDDLLTQAFGGSTKTYTYNQDGSVKTYRRPDGTVMNYTYDVLGRLLSDGFVSGAVYNSNNTIQSISGGNSSDLIYGYDEFLRLNSVTHANKTVGYIYDLGGKVTQVNYPDGKFITYEYDNANRLKRVKWMGTTTVATYTYLADNRLDRTDLGNGTYVKYTYDAGGRMTGLSNRKSDNSVINEYNYTLNQVGKVTREDMTEPLSANLLPSSTINGAYNMGNRITQLTGNVNMAFTVDVNGNTTVKGTETYQYDNEDNILRINAGTFTADYQYDATGARRRAVRSNITNNYITDPLGADNILVETDGNYFAQNYYVYGLGLTCRVKPSGAIQYYHFDFRGSTIALTDQSQNIVHTYLYDDFGNCLQVNQPNDADLNRFRYVGQYGVMWENSTTYYMRARYYDGSIGRFFSEDPIWHANLYPYTDNDPINGIDPMGLYRDPVNENLGAFFDQKYDGPDINETKRLWAGNTTSSNQQVNNKKQVDPGQKTLHKVNSDKEKAALEREKFFLERIRIYDERISSLRNQINIEEQNIFWAKKRGDDFNRSEDRLSELKRNLKDFIRVEKYYRLMISKD